MASTRRAQPLDHLHIYQDRVAHSASHSESSDVEAALLKALGASNNASPKAKLVLEPSIIPPTANSPRKSDKNSSSPAGPLGGRTLNSVSLPPPCQTDFATDSPEKTSTHQKSMPPMQVPTMHHLPSSYFTAFPPVQSNDKENMYYQHPHQSYSQPMQYQDQSYGYKAPMKRTLSSEPAPLREHINGQLGSNKKIKMTKPEEAQNVLILPDPSEMPDIEDDGTKPAHSYATLIAMAILRAQNRRLTLAQIYKWISDHYKFYRAAAPGWQNSIRHNLSLNKAFVKQERPKDDPGKGNYWAIVPGEEKGFLQKEKPTRRIAQGSDPTFVQATQHDFGHLRPSSTPAIGHFTLAPPSSSARRIDSKLVDSSKFPDDAPSSDATIPASDPALQEDEQHDSIAMPPPASRNIRSSPPPQDDIGSSPPPMVAEAARQGTPTGLPKYPSSRSGGRVQKFTSGMNDSGYYSSIESSVTRGPGFTNMVPTSDADVDRPRNIKRGRAEEEIARIRSSSYDSPSKDHGHRRKPSVHFETSSPKRPGTAAGLNPTTPGRVVFKRPALPPASISPNTNLKNHRARMQRLLGDSPSKTQMTPLRESYSAWSPGYNTFANESFVSPMKAETTTPWRDSMFNSAFNFFDYDDASARGSPGKKARPGMQRAVTSTGILADITGHNVNRSNISVPSSTSIDSPFNLAYSPFKITPEAVVQRSPPKLGSPLKRPSIAVPPSLSLEDTANAPEWLDLNIENLFGGFDGTSFSPFRQNSMVGTAGQENINRLPSDGSEEGLDILQEFGKIGAQIGSQRYAQPNQGSPVRNPSARPPLGRSVTSRF